MLSLDTKHQDGCLLDSLDGKIVTLLCLTLFCNLNLTSAKFSLFDVLDTEVGAALGVDLSFVPW